MARKSRRTMQVQAETQVTQQKPTAFYKAALYARLSMETEMNRERDTAGTQLELMRSYVAEHDDIEIAGEYCDRSISGTTFERPDFDRMMTDIKTGKINCVIVKDLSRLGRNYVETGNFIERVFPFLGVRFIAINDNFDSDKKDVDLTIPLKNIINECYAKDISRKTLAGRDSGWAQGKYVTGNYSYGYMRDPEDKHKLIVDETAAAVVKRIFRLFVKEDMNYTDIAKILSAEEIPTPDEHKFSQRGVFQGEFKYAWTRIAVKTILTNEAYLGYVVYHQTRAEFYRGVKTHRNSKDKWKYIEDAHEALVSREQFDQAQEKIANVEQNWRQIQGKKVGTVAELNFYGDRIKCMDCGARMHLRKQRQRHAYICMTYYSKGKSECLSHRVFKEDVDNAVFTVIRQHMRLCIDTEVSVRKLNESSGNRKQYKLLLEEISKMRRKIEQYSGKKEALYNDYADRLIDEEEYLTLNAKYVEETDYLKQKVDDLLIMQEQYATDYKVNADWKQNVEAYLNKRKLTKEMADAFVDYIEVAEDGSCHVHLKYDDLLKELLEIEEERKKAA